ncbi:sulfite exporter TauE/SafE family protein [Brevibacillus sp. AY1]|nr:sulfite exporter TauE/SafE family protein [Brevibacillus sp. AY1]
MRPLPCRYSWRRLPFSLKRFFSASTCTPGISAVQVFFVTLAGVWALRKDKLIHRQLVVSMGSAIIVGLASGIVGAAGAFILVPIMLIVLKIPTRVTIASSLAITFISSIGSTVGKVMAGNVLLWPSVVMVIASVLAAPLGTMVSKKLNTKILQAILAVLILGSTIKIWTDLMW